MNLALMTSNRKDDKLKMNQSEHALQGVFEYKLDPKCRVSVPSDWRQVAGGCQLRILQSSSYDLPTLRILTDEEYEDMLATVDGMEEWTPAQKKKMKGKLHSRCQKGSMSDQGKLLIPKAWCERPGIDSGEAVKLVGRGTYFEIFSLENHAAMKLKEDEETDKLNEQVDFF